MPFSSLKKSGKKNQRHYKERQQPSRRSHLGQLEKHKDYVVRARDYQRKSATLKSLRQRARERNPDEFYFHMTRSRLVDGKHSEIPAATAPESAPSKSGHGSGGANNSAENKRIRLMLLEDANYLRHKLQVERSQLAKLEAGLAFVGDSAVSGGGCTRTVFDRADFRRLSAAAAAAAGDDVALDGPQWSAHLAGLNEAEVARLAKERARALKAAQQRVARVEALSGALARLEAKRNLAAEVGRPRKLMTSSALPSEGAASGEPPPPVWKFAFKRKR